MRLNTCQGGSGMPSHMFAARLREERLRLGLSQAAFAAACGVQKLAQLKYEKGERAPDAAYLMGAAEAGVDVLYVLTGVRQENGPQFSDLDRLRIAIEAVEEGLAVARKRLEPAKKAELIAAAYELIRLESDELPAREGVVRMLRLVA